MIKIASSKRIREKITNEDDNKNKNYNNYSKKVIIALATLVGSIAAMGPIASMNNEALAQQQQQPQQQQPQLRGRQVVDETIAITDRQATSQMKQVGGTEYNTYWAAVEEVQPNTISVLFADCRPNEFPISGEHIFESSKLRLIENYKVALQGIWTWVFTIKNNHDTQALSVGVGVTCAHAVGQPRQDFIVQPSDANRIVQNTVVIRDGSNDADDSKDTSIEIKKQIKQKVEIKSKVTNLAVQVNNNNGNGMLIANQLAQQVGVVAPGGDARQNANIGNFLANFGNLRGEDLAAAIKFLSDQTKKPGAGGKLDLGASQLKPLTTTTPPPKKPGSGIDLGPAIQGPARPDGPAPLPTEAVCKAMTPPRVLSIDKTSCELPGTLGTPGNPGTPQPTPIPPAGGAIPGTPGTPGTPPPTAPEEVTLPDGTKALPFPANSRKVDTKDGVFVRTPSGAMIGPLLGPIVDLPDGRIGMAKAPDLTGPEGPLNPNNPLGGIACPDGHEITPFCIRGDPLPGQPVTPKLPAGTPQAGPGGTAPPDNNTTTPPGAGATTQLVPQPGPGGATPPPAGATTPPAVDPTLPPPGDEDSCTKAGGVWNTDFQTCDAPPGYVPPATGAPPLTDPGASTTDCDPTCPPPATDTTTQIPQAGKTDDNGCIVGEEHFDDRRQMCVSDNMSEDELTAKFGPAPDDTGAPATTTTTATAEPTCGDGEIAEVDDKGDFTGDCIKDPNAASTTGGGSSGGSDEIDCSLDENKDLDECQDDGGSGDVSNSSPSGDASVSEDTGATTFEEDTEG